MKTKAILVSGLAVAIGLAVAGRIFFKPAASQETAQANVGRVVAPEPQQNLAPPAVTPAPAPDPLPVEPASNISESAPPPPKATKPDATPKVAPQSAPAKKPKEPLQDPDARAALSLVGIDPDAEQYWFAAINDASLPAHERQDLIEDLNENGLSDPKNPGVEDLPLIVSRLRIIEELAPYAMDKVNADAFEEAYKDLAKMFARLTQR